MFYHLKNKDKTILEFSINAKEYDDIGGKNFKYEVTNITIKDASYLPKTIDINDLNNSLKSWIENRRIPNNRRFVEKVVASYSLDEKRSLMDYIDVSFGLSLNDTFWVTPANDSYKWKNYNLYDNKFDEALSLVAFSGMSHKVSGFTSSPEYTTNGMLKKCWYREWDGIYLYKGSSRAYANNGKEAYAEFYMAQVAQALGFECIKYDLQKFHNELISSCKIFTSQNEGYVPMGNFFKRGELSVENRNMKIAAIYGEDKLRDLLVFDALIYNTDRHLGNFGMIVDNDTGMPLRAAPIFDNGLSMINFLTQDELKDIDTALSDKISHFDYGFNEQLKRFVCDRHLEGLERLSKFEFEKHAEFNLSDGWLEPIQKHIQDRAKLAIKFCNENKDELKSEQAEQILNKQAVRKCFKV